MLCNRTGCDNPVSPKSKFKDCSNCRANIRGWNKRPAQALEYRRKLKVRSSRLEDVVADSDLNKHIRKFREKADG